MILQSPKKLISVAKAFSPAWLANLSPAHLFTTNPTLEESMILDPPTWPKNVARNEFWENGAPISPQRRLKRCYGPNGSFHRSIHLKQLEANRAYNAYNKKRSRYEAQQLRQKRLEELDRPIPLSNIHSQAVEQLIDSDDPDDRIFLRELAGLRNQTDNLEQFAPIAEMLESLERHRARADYAILSARRPHAVPSFSTFQRKRRARAVQEAAERKHRQAQRAKPSAEEKKEKEGKEAERKKEYEEEKARIKEAARVQMEKMREQVYREEIRNALEQGRPPPDHLQHRQDLVQEIAQLVTRAALRRQREAKRRAEEEARRRDQEMEARRRVEEEAKRYVAERERANAELFARRQAKLAEERAAREAEQRCREQEEARRRHAEAAAREEARRAQEDACRAAEVPPTDSVFEMYDNKWAALRGSKVYSGITFVQFPWPVLYQVSDISGITLDSVRAFFAHRGTSGGKAMKAEILKWHPDKFNNQLYQVHPDHREQVKEAGELVAKLLNNIMEN